MPEEEKTQVQSDHFLTLLSWEAPEYEYYEKNKDWYWSVGIVTIGFFILAIILKNWLFSIMVLISGFAVAMYGSKKPKIVQFSITSRGIKADKILYPFDNLKYFWINYDPPHIRELYLVSKKTLTTQISIPLGHIDPNEIREHLIKFIEEKEIEESLFDTIARFFRF
ncbi:hypothetical protein A3B18_00035 [Candidatus Giovannonibacteria bacterium RIFCSPLOWO2_01_FULL_46_13]|uniref:DUF5673 domain-containing protein n=1 Tax=Candidatus Giovannonibacteria bacterium RIFCSPLOWO2_01_FULL_46_13 TaxID=1798352 RepID=A0A1F5X630_9BACT|nr:MAG: hypothetical protein A3B18_00035 [Candidatus Giovannonibacteria bacterium RIFCSPLOWO2_01_FULL_46_13]